MSEPAFAIGRLFSGALFVLFDDPPPPLQAASEKVSIMIHTCLDAAFIIELLQLPSLVMNKIVKAKKNVLEFLCQELSRF
jgi:hypothetical protein